MWLFTRIGFFSATLCRDYETGQLMPELVKVRSRVREDSEAMVAYIIQLRQEAKLPANIPDPEVVEDAKADYRYRLLVNKGVWSIIVHNLVLDLDYDNFKAAVHGQADRDHAYAGVWGCMNRLQYERLQEKQCS